MKKFLKKTINLKKTVGQILIEALIESFVIVIMIFLCLTWAKDSFLALLNSIYTIKDALTVSIISLPVVIVIFETLTIGKLVMKLNDKN